MRTKRILFFGLSIFFLAVIVTYPWKSIVVVPAIKVRVLDEAGTPAPGSTVQEKWEYGLIGSKDNREISKADEDGYASFPERTERISLLRLLFIQVIDIIPIPHGHGYGPKGTV
jgi:hypothetical protein